MIQATSMGNPGPTFCQNGLLIGLSVLAMGLALAACSVRTSPASTPATGHRAAGTHSASAAQAVTNREVDDVDEDPLLGLLGQRTIELPKRSDSNRTPPAAVPDISLRLANAGNISAQAVIAWGKHRQSTRTIVRSTDRVYLGGAGNEPAWLFVRNPLDPRRVSGTLIDHQHQVLLEHDDTTLRNLGIAAGWADVAGFGLSGALLQAMQPKLPGQAQRVLGQPVTAFVVQPDKPAATDKRAVKDSQEVTVWWSESMALPLRVEAKDWHLRVVSIDANIDAAKLRDPHQQYPTYRAMDVVDWWEKVHETAHEHH